jgi:DNA-directed RNA polymerase sigma subunit (sigma70/sigma32)
MDSNLYKQVGDLARKWRKYPNVVNKADPDNRNALIEKNARLAVNTALQYRGLGLSEDELISAAFEGLAVAYDKYDGTRAATRDKMLEEITEDTDTEGFLKIAEKHLVLSNVCKMFANGIPQTPSEMREWVVKNVRPAKFSSVAYFWCRALVLNELEKYSKPLRVAENYRVDNQFQSIDDDNLYFCEKIATDETDPAEMEESYRKLYEGIPDQCVQILFLRHGIGCDEPLTLREIGARYGRSVGEIKNILSSVEDRMRDNIRRYKLKISDLLTL